MGCWVGLEGGPKVILTLAQGSVGSQVGAMQLGRVHVIGPGQQVEATAWGMSFKVYQFQMRSQKGGDGA